MSLKSLYCDAVGPFGGKSSSILWEVEGLTVFKEKIPGDCGIS